MKSKPACLAGAFLLLAGSIASARQLVSPTLSSSGSVAAAGSAVMGQLAAGTAAAGGITLRQGAIPCWFASACDPCDTNCDGSVNPFDIQLFIELLGDTATACSPCAGDANGDGTVNPFDINAFVDCLIP